MALFNALDRNHDGVITRSECASVSFVLCQRKQTTQMHMCRALNCVNVSALSIERFGLRSSHYFVPRFAAGFGGAAVPAAVCSQHQFFESAPPCCKNKFSIVKV